MAASYITAGYIDAFIGTVARQEFFDDGSGYDATAATNFNLLIQAASGVVKAAAHNAGYTSLGDTTTDPDVQRATLGQWMAFAYNRKQQRVPGEFFELVNLTTEIREGRTPLTSLSPDTDDAVGGSTFSETLSTLSGSMHQVLSRSKLEGY